MIKIHLKGNSLQCFNNVGFFTAMLSVCVALQVMVFLEQTNFDNA